MTLTVRKVNFNW